MLDLIYGLSWTFLVIYPTGFSTVSNTVVLFVLLLVVLLVAVASAFSRWAFRHTAYSSVRGT